MMVASRYEKDVDGGNEGGVVGGEVYGISHEKIMAVIYRQGRNCRIERSLVEAKRGRQKTSASYNPMKVRGKPDEKQGGKKGGSLKRAI